MAKAERTNEFALDSCVDRSTAISTRVRLFRLFLLIPCWESQRLIPKRSAGPRATKIGVVSLKALDHPRPNREESAVLYRFRAHEKPGREDQGVPARYALPRALPQRTQPGLASHTAQRGHIALPLRSKRSLH